MKVAYNMDKDHKGRPLKCESGLCWTIQTMVYRGTITHDEKWLLMNYLTDSGMSMTQYHWDPLQSRGRNAWLNAHIKKNRNE